MTFSILGRDTDGNHITVDQSDRRQGLYIIGSNGTGKSTLIENLIMQDIDQGLGVCVLDPHGDLIHGVLRRININRIDDVILLDVDNANFPFGINLYECSNPNDPSEVQKTVNRVMHIFDKLYQINLGTPQMSYYMRNCSHTILANPGYTMTEIPLLLIDESFRNTCVTNVKNRHVLHFWTQYERIVKDRFAYNREVPAILNKLDAFLQPLLETIVGQAKTTIDLRRIMDDRKILLVKLNNRLEDMTMLLGAMIIALTLDAAYSRSNLPVNKRKQFNVYADEFQRFATDDFATLLSEARKFGIATTIAHQTRSQLDTQNQANSLQSATTVVFQITPPDSSEMAGKYDTTPPEPKQEESGKRKKQVPVTDVIGHLLKNGHKDPVVNQFRYGTLAKLVPVFDNKNEPYLKNSLNAFLHKAMTGNQVFGNDLDGFIKVICSVCGSEWLGYAFRNGQTVSNSFSLFWDTGNKKTFYTLVKDDMREIIRQQITNELRKIEFTLRGIYSEKQGRDVIFLSELLPDLKQIYATMGPLVKDNFMLGIPAWFSVNIDLLQWELGKHANSWVLLPNQEKNFYNENDLNIAVDKQFLHNVTHFEGLIAELRAVCQALAQTPILGDSGEEETIYRPGPKKSHTERQNEIANMLSGLPKLTARVKLNAFPQNLQSKVCHCCGKPKKPTANFCNICGIRIQPEYAITITRNTQGMKPADLQARIDTITKKNVQDGYLRKRADVEAEILARQQQPPPPAAPAPVPAKPTPQPKQPPAGAVTQPPATPTPRKRVIGTPITKQCPSCNAQNTPTALFCNMCGSTL